VKAGDVDLINRAAALRAEFDRSFAAAPAAAATAVEDLLAIGIEGDSYLLRLAEVSGLHVDKRLMWLPSPVAELIGLAGFRGRVLPVYDLGMLLGKPRAAAVPRWTVVDASGRAGLAFDAFSGFLRARPETIVPDAREARGRHVRDVLQGDMIRPIVDLTSILQTLDRSGASGQIS
jgi:chemotaxis signal transduction protein